VAEVDPVRHRDSVDRGYGVTSGGRTYHSSSSNSKPPARLTDLGDDGYSYTDPASMYRDTEPAWRRPRAGSLERSSRPTSMIVDRAPRSSARELGPPPSQRGFDKINSNVPARSHGRSSSIDRSREIPKYEPYADPALRTSSTRHHAPAVHQEPRDPRRDTYHDGYDRRDREVENRRHSSINTLPDREVASRGFGIAPVNPALAHDHHALDRQPIWNPQETAVHSRPEDYGAQYHSTQRAEARMPELPPRPPRDREVVPPAAYDSYEKRPREREQEREGRTSFVPTVAGAATGVVGTLAAANYMHVKSREKEKDREERNSSEERERERDRERRRVYDERDSRDKVDDRRERRTEDREKRPEERREVPAIAPAYAPLPEADRKPRERRYEDEEKDRKSRKGPSPEGSDEDRPRHYVDRDAERRKEPVPAPKEAALDPDEEYRRRVQQEAERSSRGTRERDQAEPDRERRRRYDDRDGSGSPDGRSRGSPSTDGHSARFDERSSSVYDANMVQEPETFDKLQADQPSKNVTIVTPPKEPLPAVKGILRRPTEKFPEEPEPIREGVAPHKDALKGKDIPIGARWTRIDRRLVNPQALEEAKERFEERMDCVIVLRVLTKQEIQKLADRTKKIRERRGTLLDTLHSQIPITNAQIEDEYDDRNRDRGDKDKDDRDDRDRDDRDKRSHRDDRDDEDRDRGRDRDRERRRRYDDEDSEFDDGGRDRERERERLKLLEPAR
jgi:hypothetical protein